MNSLVSLGANYLGGNRCCFRVWSPLAHRVEVCLLAPRERLVPLSNNECGYHEAVVDGVNPGTPYLYRLDGNIERPDPASRFQPRGVHDPSQVIDPRFDWTDGRWTGLSVDEYVLYEVHVGTFSQEGVFDAVIPRLEYLKELGITAIELMPVAQFPGSRNWGYDGAYPFAVQNSYGGPAGLKRLVNAAHAKGLAIVLDVVYNHLGPEGNYLRDYGPYFTDRYKTPWGAAVNYDGEYSDGVRHFFIENAIYWIAEFHIDALRIDAVHAILDFSAQPFLEQLALAVREHAERLGRKVYLIAESDLNDAGIIRSPELGGIGLDAQWNDDFHHALHALLTEEKEGYYQDFGELRDLATAFREGYVYSGRYSRFRRRRHGNSSRDIDPNRFVVFSQNHDQVGNRMMGERLSELVSFEALKLAATAVLLSPFIPLLFMGEEYAETARFPYFVSHLDPELVEGVRKGRQEEFAQFQWRGQPPDPQDEQTFVGARLNHHLRRGGHHAVLLDFHKELIRLRKTVPALTCPRKEHMEVYEYQSTDVLTVRRWKGHCEGLLALHFGATRKTAELELPAGSWSKQLDSSEPRWQGPGSDIPDNVVSTGREKLNLQPHECVFFVRETRY